VRRRLLVDARAGAAERAGPYKIGTNRIVLMKIGYSRAMALFRVGDRVASVERPDDAGTITAIVADQPAGATYRVGWDDGSVGEITEAVLLRANLQALEPD
jgi:hypothetical protein